MNQVMSKETRKQSISLRGSKTPRNGLSPLRASSPSSDDRRSIAS